MYNVRRNKFVVVQCSVIAVFVVVVIKNHNNHVYWIP